MSARRVLITGVCGFIGSNLAEALLQRGDAVVGLDNLSQGFRQNVEPFLGHPNFQLVEGDIRDPKVFDSLAPVDCIAHLAAFKIPRYGNALDTLEVNSLGTWNVLRWASHHRTKVLFSSTSDVYGKNPQLPFSEESDAVLGPATVKRWAYAVSKLFDEHLCFAFAERHQIPVVIVRYFGAYGPRQNFGWWGGPQGVFIDCALRDEPIPIHGDGQQTRCFAYISDVIEGTVRALDEPRAVGQIINLGGNEEVTILELARRTWGLVRDTEPKIERIPYQNFGRYEDVRRRVPDLTKAKELLGVVPTIGLTEGLSRTIAWRRSGSASPVAS